MSATATAPNKSATIITTSGITLTDRIRIQQQRIRDREYTRIGRLTTVVMERQLPTAGISQSSPRWANAEQRKQFEQAPANAKPFHAPFSEWQSVNWVNLTLDWLGHKTAPILAISMDRNDLLLPLGLTPLPKIPDPLWIPRKADDIAPRVEQKLESRACGTIKDRISGKTYAIFQPLTELQVMCGGGKDSGFGRIKCATDPADHTHAALLVNIEPESDGSLEAYFVGGAFHAG
jgi:hypothetical protein